VEKMKKEIAKNEYYEMYADIEKNRSYSVYRGFWPDTDEFLNTYKSNLRKTIGHLTPGFTSVVDLRKLKVPSTKVMDTFVEVQKFQSDAGVSKAARVVQLAITKIAADRVGREGDAEEKAGIFDTIEQAEVWLDN
jgi:hypothetical protein